MRWVVVNSWGIPARAGKPQALESNALSVFPVSCPLRVGDVWIPMATWLPRIAPPARGVNTRGWVAWRTRFGMRRMRLSDLLALFGRAPAVSLTAPHGRCHFREAFQWLVPPALLRRRSAARWAPANLGAAGRCAHSGEFLIRTASSVDSPLGRGCSWKTRQEPSICASANDDAERRSAHSHAERRNE
jgi:hypothetical protein